MKKNIIKHFLKKLFQSMRYLKNKIAKAIEHYKHISSLPFQSSLSAPSKVGSLQTSEEPLKKSKADIVKEVQVEDKKVEKALQKKRSKRSFGNNVMKNYSAAMKHFALSHIAVAYLSELPEIEIVSHETFRSILISKKKVNCIKTLRKLLLQEEGDSRETREFKTLFQKSCLVFIKFFSINWIFNSKLTERSKYLHYRGKLLRRIQNPQYFTYLEDFKEEKGKRKNGSQKKSKKI